MSHVRHRRSPPVKYTSCGYIQQSTPRDMPPPTLEDLDFDDPPSFLGSQIERIFWCLSARVRKLIMEKYPRKVFFCFYKGVCTWSCDDNPGIAKCRIKLHHQKQPHHFIGPHWVQLKPWVEEVERRKKIRNEIRRGRRKDDVRDVDIRPKTKFTERPLRAGLLKGVTYHYPNVKVEKSETWKEGSYDKFDNWKEESNEKFEHWKEGSKQKFERRPPWKFKEERSLEREKGETKLKSQIYFVDRKVKIEGKNKIVENTNIKVTEKSMEENIKPKQENLITGIYEAKTIKENIHEEDETIKEDIQFEDKEPISNDSLSADEDKTIKSLFEVDFPKHKVYPEKQLTKLIKQRLKLKQKRPKIVIGPIKGRKLRLNEKKFKVKLSPFEPVENKIKIKLEKIMSCKESEDSTSSKLEAVEVADAQSVEIGTCKYCDECIPLKDMKDHYLTHIDETNTDTNTNKTEGEDEDITSDKPKTEGPIPALQENSISSTENIQDIGPDWPDRPETDICKTSVMSKKEIEDKVKQKFDAYAKETKEDKPNSDDKNACAEFIRRWGPILDIDDLSQYDEFDTTKFSMFFESINRAKKHGNDSISDHENIPDDENIKNGDVKNTNINKGHYKTCTATNDFITNEYGTTIANIDSSPISKQCENIPDIDKKSNKNEKEMDENIQKKANMGMDDVKDATISANDGMEKEGQLLNIIKNPRSLTGHNLEHTKVQWSLGDREIVYQDENIYKGAKLSLDECFQKFTDKVEMEVGALKQQTKNQEARQDVTDGSKITNLKSNVTVCGNSYKKTSILMNKIGVLDDNYVEKTFTETEIKKEVLSLSIDANRDIKEPSSLTEEPYTAIKTEYLNREPISEEYFEDIPSENEMDIKHENEANLRNIADETPASRLERLINLKMEEPQLITEHMIGEVQIGYQFHPKRKHSEIHKNEKRRRVNQFNETVGEVNVGELIIKTFPSDESFETLQNIKLADNVLESVPRIKEEPNIDAENNPNDPLSVMFVVWKDDNCIDMIEDDLAHKDDLERCIAPSVVRPTNYKPQIPRLKLSIPSSSNPVTYQPFSNFAQKTAQNLRFKKFNKTPSEDINQDRDSFGKFSMKNPSDKSREVKIRQCNSPYSPQNPNQGSKQSQQSNTRRKIENLHLVKRRGVFTINRETAKLGDCDSSMGQGRRSSTRQGTDPDTIYLQLDLKDNCDNCPSCKERLSPMGLDWRVNVVKGTVDFACNQCGQKVCVEGPAPPSSALASPSTHPASPPSSSGAPTPALLTTAPVKPVPKKCKKKKDTCSHEIAFGNHYDRKEWDTFAVRLAKSLTVIDPDYVA